MALSATTMATTSATATPTAATHAAATATPTATTPAAATPTATTSAAAAKTGAEVGGRRTDHNGHERVGDRGDLECGGRSREENE